MYKKSGQNGHILAHINIILIFLGAASLIHSGHISNQRPPFKKHLNALYAPLLRWLSHTRRGRSSRGGSKPCRTAITAIVPYPQLNLSCALCIVLVCAALATQLSAHKNCPAPGPQTSSAYITPSSASASARSLIQNAFLLQKCVMGWGCIYGSMVAKLLLYFGHFRGKTGSL